MEGFVKGSFLSVITFFVIACLLIIGLPWLWNWIVFIFQSPLSAGQASKAYLIDSFMECLPFILTTILILLSLDVVINRRYPTVEDEVEMFAGSKIYSPTPMSSGQNLSPNAPTEQKEAANISGVGEDVIVTEHTDNGGIFHHVKKGSKEYQDVIRKNAERQRSEEKKEVEKMYSEQNGNPMLQRLARVEK